MQMYGVCFPICEGLIVGSREGQGASGHIGVGALGPSAPKDCLQSQWRGQRIRGEAEDDHQRNYTSACP